MYKVTVGVLISEMAEDWENYQLLQETEVHDLCDK
jgi:hypothetical protein